MTKTMIAGLRPVSEETLAIASRGRGRPPSEAPKETISLRVDQDVLAHFRAGGPGWQTRMNEALRKAARRR